MAPFSVELFWSVGSLESHISSYQPNVGSFGDNKETIDVPRLVGIEDSIVTFNCVGAAMLNNIIQFI